MTIDRFTEMDGIDLSGQIATFQGCKETLDKPIALWNLPAPSFSTVDLQGVIEAGCFPACAMEPCGGEATDPHTGLCGRHLKEVEESETW